MPRYIEVVQATTETATKILALRESGKTWIVSVTTEGGRTASVKHRNGNPVVILNMPTLPPDAILTRAEADRLVAFIVHECCHVLHTTSKAWDRACALGDRVRTWTNCLEDVRIEQAEIKAGAFPAMRSLLGTMANHLHMETLAGGMVIGDQIAHAPFIASVLGRIANGYAIPAAHGLRAGMAPNVAQLVDHALVRIRRCRNTAAVVDLARELVNLEHTAANRPQPQPQDGQDGQDASQGAQDGQNGQAASQGAQDGQDGQDASQGAQDGQDGQDASQGAQDGQDAPSGDMDLTGTVARIADRAGIDQRTYGHISNAHHLATVRSTVEPGNQVYSGPQGAWGRQLDGRLPRNSVLHGQIGRLLVSEEVHRRTHHESSGRLDRRALVRMRAGAMDVYSRRDDTPGIDTALLVLIDGSSSMAAPTAAGCSRMAIAQTTAWHIAKAAEAANAKVAVAAFHTPVAAQLLRRSNTMTGATVTVVKPWSVPIADRAAQLATVKPDAWTPLSPAIMATAGMLAEVNASRHILMVLTDGECDYGEDGVRTACKLAEDLGVETVGVGMACQSVIDAFPPRYSVNVNDLTQLASTGLGVLVAMLEDASPRGSGND
jgi:hypothetical protein